MELLFSTSGLRQRLGGIALSRCTAKVKEEVVDDDVWRGSPVFASLHETRLDALEALAEHFSHSTARRFSTAYEVDGLQRGCRAKMSRT